MLKQLWEYRSFVVVTPCRFVTDCSSSSLEYHLNTFSSSRNIFLITAAELERVKPICYTRLYIPIQLLTYIPFFTVENSKLELYRTWIGLKCNRKVPAKDTKRYQGSKRHQRVPKDAKWFQRDQKPLKVSKIKELFKGTKRYQRVPKGKKMVKKTIFVEMQQKWNKTNSAIIG